MTPVTQNTKSKQTATLDSEQSADAAQFPAQREWEICRLSALELVLKRVADLLVSAAVLVLCLPLMAFIAIVVKLDSPGPILFVQTRVGYRGRKFRFYKFRSMHRDAEEIRGSLLRLNEASGPVFKIRNDPRITRVGRILRKFSLDELPQLVNVLLGDMSLVGARPQLPCEVVAYTTHDWKRLSAQPGITCLWQIGGRSDIPFEQWVELDIEYIRRQSLWLDLKILIRTIPAVVSGRGAH